MLANSSANKDTPINAVVYGVPVNIVDKRYLNTKKYKYMSTDITTKQHYVWRRYLCAWKVNADDKDIWTGFLKTKEVKKIALMGVA